MKIFLTMMLSLVLMACERQDREVQHNSAAHEQDYDNTGKNVRDRDSMTKTPFDQSESQVDRTITQKIRQAIMADSALSTNAKNIKIITIKGVVTLRGPVASPQENEIIVRKISEIPGIIELDNKLEITRPQ